MNRDRLLSAGMAVCCVLAIGLAAATMESAVRTSPDDVVDFEYSRLPIDADEAGELKRQVQGEGTEQGRVDAGGESGGDRAESRGPAEAAAQARDRAESSGPDRRQRRAASAAGLDRRRDGTADPEPPRPDLLDRLLALLEALVAALLRLAWLLVLPGLVGLAVRYRDRLWALLGRPGDGRPGDPGGGGEQAGPPAPGDDVERAWLAVVRHLGLVGDRTVSPRECAAAAVAAGADREPVEALTATFEAVRYGDAPVTDERRSRARRAARAIRRGTGERP